MHMCMCAFTRVCATKNEFVIQTCISDPKRINEKPVTTVTYDKTMAGIFSYTLLYTVMLESLTCPLDCTRTCICTQTCAHAHTHTCVQTHTHTSGADTDICKRGG